jgi:hypothetical protein
MLKNTAENKKKTMENKERLLNKLFHHAVYLEAKAISFNW